MKYSILTLVLAVGTTFGQVQSNTTAQHSEEHSSSTVNPDGTAVQHKSSSDERTDSTNNSDGSSRTTRTKQTQSKTKVRSEAPIAPLPPVNAPSTESHSSTTTTTHDEVVKP